MSTLVPARTAARLLVHLDRARPTRPVVEGGGCPCAALAAGALGVGRQPRRQPAINTFVVSPRFGAPPEAELLRQQFVRRSTETWTYRLSGAARKPRRAGNPGRRREPPPCPVMYAHAPPRIIWFDGTAPGQVRAALRSGGPPRTAVPAGTASSNGSAPTCAGRRSPRSARPWSTPSVACGLDTRARVSASSVSPRRPAYGRAEEARNGVLIRRDPAGRASRTRCL